MKKATMQEIADKLGISKNSVSLALSGKPGVSEELRKKVLDTAEIVGYKGKEKLSPQKSLMVGLICREEVFSDHAFFGSMIFNIEKEVKKRKGHLLVYSVDDEEQTEGTLPDFISGNKVDGLLILSHLKLDYLKKLNATNYPMVLIDHHHPDLNVDCILTDNRKGAYRAVTHALKSGLMSVGFMGPIDRSPSYQERFEGYLEALNKQTIEVNSDWIVTNIDENVERIKSYLASLHQLPECWFCSNDEYGLLVSQALTFLNLKVPENCSVIGFDNSYYAKLANPSLTTMGINIGYFAKRSVGQLFDRIQDQNRRYEKVLLDTDLVVRDSLRKS